jgi:ABC-type branched-subunit amino acid transport system substrate-binding protein
MIGDDYVWPRKCNEQAKKYIAENGGKVTAEEYVPFGAPNKFEEVVTRIKSAKTGWGSDHPRRRRQREFQPHLCRLWPR